MSDIYDEEQIRRNIGGFDKLSAAKKERMRIKRLKKAERKKYNALIGKANKFDDLTKEVVKLFVAGQFDQGAEAVQELAQIWKGGGQTKQSFLDLMEYIEKQTVEQTGFESTRIHIQDALRKKTGGGRIIIT